MIVDDCIRPSNFWLIVNVLEGYMTEYLFSGSRHGCLVSGGELFDLTIGKEKHLPPSELNNRGTQPIG